MTDKKHNCNQSTKPPLADLILKALDDSQTDKKDRRVKDDGHRTDGYP